jgi:prepilin-type N-terminal cleavage/methylation domain-containing protein
MRARRGFTLLEIVIVMLILAIMAGVAVPAFKSLFVEDDITTATHRVEALFRLARDSAIRGGQPVTVVIDSVSGFVWLDTPNVIPASDTVSAGWSEPLASGSALGGALTPGVGNVKEYVRPGEPLGLPASVELALTRARARFTFGPGGSAFADTLVLRTGLEMRTLTVNRWTGDAIVF